MAGAPYLMPFVLPLAAVEPERSGTVDLYAPDTVPAPAILFVHGGPIPAELRPTPREWPVYRGYGAAAAARGAVGATVDHRLYGPAEFPTAAADVAAAVDQLRADPRVDADRVALWFFSGGGLLSADWLREPPPWLRCLALTYPVLGSRPGRPIDERFDVTDALSGAGELSIVLTRVGLEGPDTAATVATFVNAARASGLRLAIVDAPDGQHGFDHLDHTDESRDAVERALAAVLGALTG